MVVHNEKTAEDIVWQCLYEAGVGQVADLGDLSKRIVACLAEVELIPEDTIAEAVAAYHGISLDEATSLVFEGYFSVDGVVVVDPSYRLKDSTVVQSSHSRYYSSFIV